MESIGQTLKTAREKKRISLSQAAAKTRIMTQVLDGLERDDYSKIPAPAYGRGFIRMYAEFLGLEAGPLVAAYNALQSGKGKAEPAKPAAPKPASPKPAREPEPINETTPAAEPNRVQTATAAALSSVTWRRAGILVGGIMLVIALIALFARGGSEKAAKKPEGAPAPKRNLAALVEEPPEPYLQAGTATNKP